MRTALRPALRSVHRCGRHRKDIPRTLHLIDLENLCPQGQVTTSSVLRVWNAYLSRVGVVVDDGVVVGVGAGNAVTAFCALPAGIRRVVGRGPDGADLALLRAADPEWIRARFQRVVVASGDHIFAPLVGELRRLGMSVNLALGDGFVAAELYRSCPTVYRLPLDL